LPINTPSEHEHGLPPSIVEIAPRPPWLSEQCLSAYQSLSLAKGDTDRFLDSAFW
jgi:hypothetical protein